MNRILQLFHGELFRFWYGKNNALCYYHGKKFNQIQSMPVGSVNSGIQFKNYRHSLVLAAQSVAIVVSFVGFMLACVAQFG